MPGSAVHAAKSVRVLLAGAVALTLAACGSATSTGTSSTGAASAVSSAVVPGGLEPDPLPERATVTATTGFMAETISVMLLADRLGEFEKENIALDLQLLSSSESLPALAQGKTDVSAGGLNAGLFNGISSGADIRIVYPGPTNNTVDGLWVRKDPETGEPVKVTTVGNTAGLASTQIVPISDYLESVGSSVTDVEFVTLPAEDLAFALEQGVVDAAWLTSPLQIPIEASGAAERVITYEPDAFGLGYMMGPNLLRERPEVARAFIRALERTAETYLTGDYKSDPEVVAALAKALEATPEEISRTPSSTFGSEISPELYERAQALWLEVGDIVSYDTPLAPAQYVDTSILDGLRGES